MVTELWHQEKKAYFISENGSKGWSSVFREGKLAFNLCFRISVLFTLNFENEKDT